MTVTFTEIAAFAREVLQTDSTDLTDTMLLVFTNDAVERIIGLRPNWPHLYTEGTLAMVASDGQYALNSASFNPTTFTVIESIWDDNGYGTSLNEIDYQEATAYWIGTNQTESDRPSWFANYGNNIYLYPLPSSTRTLRVGGYREPTAVAVGADEPDLPAALHNAVQYAVVSMSIAQTEDYEGARWWAEMANFSTAQGMRSVFGRTTHRPVQMHGRGGPRRWFYRDWVRSMIP